MNFYEKKYFFARKSSFEGVFIAKTNGDAMRIDFQNPLPAELPVLHAPTHAVHLIDQMRRSDCHHAADFLSSLISKAEVVGTNFNPALGEFIVEFDRPYTVYLANLRDGLKGTYIDPEVDCNRLVLNQVLKGKIEKLGNKEVITFTPESGWIPFFFGRRANLVPISYLTEEAQITVAIQLPIFGNIGTSLANFKGILNHSYLYPEYPENSHFNHKQLVHQYKIDA